MGKLPEDEEWSEFHDIEITNWKRVRSAIEHENQLTNHRLTWLLSSQAFLFTAFALVFQASTKTDAELKIFYQFILAGFSGTGIFVSFYLQLPLRIAELQHARLRAWWYASVDKSSSSRHPPICGDPPNKLYRILPTSRLPFVFVVVWSIFALVVFADIIKPYSMHIGVALLALTLAVGLISIGVMLGRYQIRS